MAKPRKTKRWKKKCDSLYSRIICAIGRCAICGQGNVQLHCHHLISRAAIFFRHNLNNGICLCARCHSFDYGQRAQENDPEAISAHGAPWAFEAWLESNRPDQYAWFAKNRHKIFTGLKIDWEQVYSVLKDKAEELGVEAA